MTAPEIRWEHGNSAGYRGYVGSLNAVVFDISYRTTDRYSLRCSLPGFTKPQLFRGTEDECRAFARRVLVSWLKKLHETPEPTS